MKAPLDIPNGLIQEKKFARETIWILLLPGFVFRSLVGRVIFFFFFSFSVRGVGDRVVHGFVKHGKGEEIDS